ncbi:MAG: 2-hydroxyacid dehydrogenase [Acidobacteriaceae bacterium]
MTSCRPYDQQFLAAANNSRHGLVYTETVLIAHTATMAQGFPAICPFVEDTLGEEALQTLVKFGTRLIVLRSTGYNHVDLVAAKKLGVTVMRVRAYFPYAVAEFALALMFTLNRQLHRAYNRVREGNFLLDGLLGFDMHGKTVGLVGTGRIGAVLARILKRLGCNLLGYDNHPSPECEALGLCYTPLEDLLRQSHIVSLHLPLSPKTYHLINTERLAQMRPGAMLINTSRGGLIDTKALINALKSQHLGSVGLDVYEEEGDIYFQDHSDDIVYDDTFERLLTFPNVIVTGHQAFFTREALETIATTTIQNLRDYCEGRSNGNEVVA